MALRNFLRFFFYIEILLVRHLNNYWSQGLDIWYTEWEWDVNYQLTFGQIP